MGGRGASAGTGGTGGRNAKMGDFFTPRNDDSLDSAKIRRANSASVMDMGDIVNRTYERDKAEVQTLNLSDSEKKDAVSELKRLSNNALDSASKAISPFASGRSRLSSSQISGSAADKAASDRAKVDNYMDSLRRRSRENGKKTASANLVQQLRTATAEGKTEIYVNGKRYYRKSKRGSNWYS